MSELDAITHAATANASVRVFQSHLYTPQPHTHSEVGAPFPPSGRSKVRGCPQCCNKSLVWPSQQTLFWSSSTCINQPKFCFSQIPRCVGFLVFARCRFWKNSLVRLGLNKQGFTFSQVIITVFKILRNRLTWKF